LFEKNIPKVNMKYDCDVESTRNGNIFCLRKIVTTDMNNWFVLTNCILMYYGEFRRVICVVSALALLTWYVLFIDFTSRIDDALLALLIEIKCRNRRLNMKYDCDVESTRRRNIFCLRKIFLNLVWETADFCC